MPDVILYAFWGRKANVETQLPYIRSILDQHLNVRFEGWDLCRDPSDSRYLRSLPTSDRFRVRTEFYQGNGRATSGQNRVWKHYAAPRYAGTTFLKLDDDVLFLDVDQFGDFIQAAVNNPDSVISALTINHGASTHLIADLWAMYETLDIPLLDVHLSTEYCERSHRWFLDNWQTLIAEPEATITPATSWTSINCIAFQHQVGKRIADLLGTRPPEQIMDREYPYRLNGRQTRYKVGDEGAANMQPLLIHTGFVAAHLNFGPQVRAMDPAALDVIRKGYADLARQYLGGHA